MLSNCKSLCSLASTVVLMLLTACVHANTLQVAAGGSIQAAINTASPGDTILVAAGTYLESLTWKTKDLTIQGAGAGQTIVDADVFHARQARRCLYTEALSSASHIEGFTFQGGNVADYGGGMYNYGSSLAVTRCTFVGNTADSGGGGMFNYANNPTLTHCAFIGNSCYDSIGGGGVLNFSSSPTLTNCTFYGNRSSFSAAGGGVHNASSSATMTNCTFYGNSSAFAGSGVFNNNSSVTMTNCVVWGNSPSFFPGSIYNRNASLTITHSDVQDYSNTTPDANVNFGADPLFVDAANGDLRLQPGSPCVNGGLDSAIPLGVTTDLDGNPRRTGAHVDLGAYELQNLAPIAHDNIVSVVKNTALAIPVLANDIDTSRGGLTIQSTTPASHGSLTVNSNGTITYTPANNYLGADTFTYTFTDSQGEQGTATVYVNVALQTSVLVTNASCVGTGSVALYARLVQGTVASKTNLLAGQPLLFLVNGVPVGTGITDAYGKASVNYLPVAAGSFPITVQFTGSGTYVPSQGTGTLTVSPSATEVTVQPSGGQIGGGTTLRGRLARTNGNQGLVGMTVMIYVDGGFAGTVTTGADGFFTCAYSIPPDATIGANNIMAYFTGNALNSPSTGSATLTVAP